jgi:hypothetical protein
MGRNMYPGFEATARLLANRQGIIVERAAADPRLNRIRGR